jgi:flavorubredoxin
MDKPRQLLPDIHILPAHMPILSMGFLPVNAFVIKAKEPVLVDTGMGKDSEEFMSALKSIIDPQELRWLWLTHDDGDHTGSIQKVLEAAPSVKLAANALAVLRLGATWPVPLQRVYWLNPGDSIDVGDRKLTAVRPPLFDNPCTIGIYDNKSEALFSADCFGAIIPSPAQNADDVKPDDLVRGMMGWATADSPWIHMVEPSKFGQSHDGIRKISPKMIFSSHLPPARGKIEQFLELLARLPASPPFVAPDQAVLEQVWDQMRSGS